MVSIIRDDEGRETGSEEGSSVTITTPYEQFDSNLSIAQSEAWPGSITVEQVPEDERPSTEPSQQDKMEAQLAYTAMMTDTLLEV